MLTRSARSLKRRFVVDQIVYDPSGLKCTLVEIDSIAGRALLRYHDFKDSRSWKSIRDIHTEEDWDALPKTRNGKRRQPLQGLVSVNGGDKNTLPSEALRKKRKKSKTLVSARAKNEPLVLIVDAKWSNSTKIGFKAKPSTKLSTIFKSFARRAGFDEGALIFKAKRVSGEEYLLEGSRRVDSYSLVDKDTIFAVRAVLADKQQSTDESSHDASACLLCQKERPAANAEICAVADKQVIKAFCADDDTAPVRKVCQQVYILRTIATYRQTEGRYEPKCSYMIGQPDINANMRAILVDWLVEVSAKFKLGPESLFLAVNVLDRFLEREEVGRKKLQLVGCTALYIACKYEENYYNTPRADDFVYISDSAFARDELLDMESKILNALGFHMTVPTAAIFVQRYAKVLTCGSLSADKVTMLATFLVHRMLQEYTMLTHQPSLVAASSMQVAFEVCGDTEWGSLRVHHTGYTKASLAECTGNIIDLVLRGEFSSLKAVKKTFEREYEELNLDEDLISPLRRRVFRRTQLE